MKILDFIFKSKAERVSESFNRAMNNGGRVVFHDPIKVKKEKRIEHLPWITIIICLIGFSIAAVSVEKFSILNVFLFVLYAMSVLIVLYPIGYYITSRFAYDPDRYNWISYSIEILLASIFSTYMILNYFIK